MVTIGATSRWAIPHPISRRINRPSSIPTTFVFRGRNGLCSAGTTAMTLNLEMRGVSIRIRVLIAVTLLRFDALQTLCVSLSWCVWVLMQMSITCLSHVSQPRETLPHFRFLSRCLCVCVHVYYCLLPWRVSGPCLSLCVHVCVCVCVGADCRDTSKILDVPCLSFSAPLSLSLSLCLSFSASLCVFLCVCLCLGAYCLSVCVSICYRLLPSPISGPCLSLHLCVCLYAHKDICVCVFMRIKTLLSRLTSLPLYICVDRKSVV